MAYVIHHGLINHSAAVGARGVLLMHAKSPTSPEKIEIHVQHVIRGA